MVFRGWPDDYLFKQSVTALLARARGEGLWNGILASETFSLLCAYPKSGFTQDANTSIQELCAMHTKVC